MRRPQLDALLGETTTRYGYARAKDFQREIRLRPTSGRHKGKNCLLVEVYNSELVFAPVDSPETQARLHYAKVDLLDDAGEPITEPVRDMTGRDVEEGAVLAYSRPAGRGSHAMEIGRVMKINDSGSLSVRAMVRNGEKITTEWRSERTTVVNDPDRCILLPCELSLVTMWVLSDFEALSTDDLMEMPAG